MNSPRDILLASAARFGSKIALVTDTVSLSYDQQNDLTNRVATALVSRGLQPGQVVSLCSEKRWEWIVAYHAALTYVLENCCATTLFISGEKAPTLA